MIISNHFYYLEMINNYLINSYQVITGKKLTFLRMGKKAVFMGEQTKFGYEKRLAFELLHYDYSLLRYLGPKPNSVDFRRLGL